jgi:thioredoxin 1
MSRQRKLVPLLFIALILWMVADHLQGLKREAAAHSENLVMLTADSFDEQVLKVPGLVLVDFYADWCGPCKRIAPSIAALADEFKGRVVVGKLNTDYAQSVAQQWNVSGIPCLILYRGGEEISRRVGAESLETYRAWVTEHLPSAS